MSKIGRNDPCLCGSGKKYKKCCLAKTFQAIGREESIKEKLVQDILAFSKQHYRDLIDDAVDYFWFDTNPEEYLDNDYLRFADINFWEWLVHDWVPDEEAGQTLIELYMEDNKRLSTDEIRVLNMMKNAVISLYEVQEVFPEEGLLLKDLLMAGEYSVREKIGTRSLRKWDIFAARLLRLDGKYIMSGCAYPYPMRGKESIIDYINGEFEDFKADFPDGAMDEFLKTGSDIFNFLWANIIPQLFIPKLSTTTGEPMLFSKAIFEITDRDAAINKLKKLKDLKQEDENRFVWLSNSGEDFSTVLGNIDVSENKLILECNSKKRLEKGKKIILKYIPELVMHKVDTFQNPEQAMRERKDIHGQKKEDEIPFEIQQEIYTQFMKKHCEGLFNEKIPMLGNETPLEAVRTLEGRKKVVEWLKVFENNEEYNKKEGSPYYDISWMWERLGIKKD